MRKYFAELFGTFMLVFLGTGTVVIAGADTLAIGLSFGLAITIMAYTVGGISGGQFNPAVTIAMVINKRTELKDGIFYICSQFIGATLASLAISFFTSALGLPLHQFGQTDFPNITAFQAIVTEAIITFLFILVILFVTSKKYGNSQMAPLAIGLVLSFLIIVALNLTGGSLNPARSFGPSLFAGGDAIAHYWVYLVGPIVGGVIAAFVGRFFGTEEDAA